VDTALVIIQTDNADQTAISLYGARRILCIRPKPSMTKLKPEFHQFPGVAAGAKDYSYTGLDMFAAHNPD